MAHMLDVYCSFIRPSVGLSLGACHENLCTSARNSVDRLFVFEITVRSSGSQNESKNWQNIPDLANIRIFENIRLKKDLLCNLLASIRRSLVLIADQDRRFKLNSRLNISGAAVRSSIYESVTT